MPKNETGPQQSGVSHVGLSVTDLDRSLSFYRDVLGALLVRAPFGGDRAAFSGRMAILMLGLTVLDLFEHGDNHAERFDPARTGLDHLALMADSYEDLDAWARWLDAHDIEHSEIRDSGGFGAQFDFVDPDGIQIEFCFLDQDMMRDAASALRARDDAKANH
jgi:glyoxylase I family protein